eukprot:Polyplicarium_translucidae@DN2918_c0_g1_i4.p1
MELEYYDPALVDLPLLAHRKATMSFIRAATVNDHLSWADVTFVVQAFALMMVVRLIISGAYHRKFSPRWALVGRLLPHDVPKRKVQKLNENVWYSLYHSSSFLVNMYVLHTERGTREAPRYTPCDSHSFSGRRSIAPFSSFRGQGSSAAVLFVDTVILALLHGVPTF